MKMHNEKTYQILDKKVFSFKMEMLIHAEYVVSMMINAKMLTDPLSA